MIAPEAKYACSSCVLPILQQTSVCSSRQASSPRLADQQKRGTRAGLPAKPAGPGAEQQHISLDSGLHPAFLETVGAVVIDIAADAYAHPGSPIPLQVLGPPKLNRQRERPSRVGQLVE